ncbi:MAG: uroporphyrinogen decarboxylase [Candidimonas sp.]|uniref:Uroporphyrinogen decarboxylase n=2 Tax=Pollutimonas thiosulfatoxidans TaxID=2028345 RepID=A0A410GDI3_9BURK|nr:uroporphyrinogen decarboxylase [Pollutimonas thiosulfatoxidans]MBF6617509.1 uroporphyrinogen decarboxylase [Candidimonas sp.]NYT44115.1 uroporphyrinogen decarboxylase [Alcaligenaceae bacterium]QAA94362.1 uroporphyrinogen decarboxylase [Pollutimonas thiosulfatoxidans]
MTTPTLKNDVFLRALMREPVPYTPIWMMRQAGRYLPEYNETRAKAGSFLALAQNREYACEVTLQPLMRFDLDAAILFSDILTVPHAMGLGLDFVAGEGPKFAHPVRNEDDVKRLAVPDLARLQYVFDAITLIRKELDGKVPLIGFAGSPWTVGCYMVEGQGSDDYRLIKTMLYSRPDLLHRMLEVNALATQQYLNAQIQAGAQAVMIFDSWGGALADGHFQEFSLAYTRKVVDGLIREHEGRRVPVIVFTKGGALWLEDIAGLGCDAVGLDWTANLAKARQRTGDAVALQGNLDPMALFGGDAAIRREVRRVIDDFGTVGAGGHVFNLGHGISRFTPPAAVSTLVDEVHTYSRGKH